MRRICTAVTTLAVLPAVFTSCQHIPPEPLDMHAMVEGLEVRDLDVESVREFAAALPGPAPGETTHFDPSDGLSLREAQAVALWYNPECRIARLEAIQAKAAVQHEGRWADPEFAFEVGEKEVESSESESRTIGAGTERTTFTREAKNIDRSWIGGATLSLTIPVSGRLAAQKHLLGTQYEVALLHAGEVEWRSGYEVREAWLRWSIGRQRLDLLDRHLALVDRFYGVIDALVGAGEISSAAGRIWAIERGRREAERERAKFAVDEGRIEIAMLLGLLPSRAIELISSLAVPAPASMDDMRAHLAEYHPRIVRSRAEYAMAEAALRVELKKQYPDITISPTYADEQDESSLVLGLGFPVPVWNANRKGIAEAAAARDVARARVEHEYQRVLAEVAQAEAAISGARAQHAMLSDVARAVDEQLAAAFALLDMGELDPLLLFEGLTQSLEIKQELLDAALAKALAESRLASAETPFSYPIAADEKDPNQDVD